MIQVSVVYPKGGGSTFDEKYYLEKHVPMVKERLTPKGLVKAEVYRGVSGPDPSQPPTYVFAAYLYFNTVEEVHQAFMAEAHDIMGDIPNYTSINPIVQISESVD